MFLCPHPMGQSSQAPPGLQVQVSIFCSQGLPSASARQRCPLVQGRWALWAQGFPCWEAGWAWAPWARPSGYLGWLLMDACGRNLFWLFRAKEGMYGEDPGSKDRMHWSSRTKLKARALGSLFSLTFTWPCEPAASPPCTSAVSMSWSHCHGYTL